MNPEQEALLSDAQDSIDAAKLLLENGFHKFAVSRLYYSMFYTANAFLRGEGFAFSKHSAVIGKFGEVFAKTQRIDAKFHRYLIDAQEARLESDYEPGTQFSEAQVIEYINQAEEFLALARSILTPTS
ncbi:MAG TPA: HEPN domain-containing protein, partial [Aggregatilineales bacterium]|nr:HEPN domain-containing protein [Aggregatilineales bacterium]